MAENFPDQLKQYPQWILWKWGKRQKNGKLAKVPLSPVNQPLKWRTYADTLAAFQAGQGDGIGFVFISPADLDIKRDPDHIFADGKKKPELYADWRAALASGQRSDAEFLTSLVGIDLDGCRDPTTGELTPEAQATVEGCPNWYWEISVSGTGLHGLGFSSLVLGNGYHRGNYETYNTGRYFVCTGDYLSGEQSNLSDHTPAHAVWYAAHFPPKGPKLKAVPNPQAEQPAQPCGFPGTDVELIALAKKAANGAKFTALWSGDIGAYSSPSEADQALMNLIAFWTGGDAARMGLLFNQSGLGARDKWQDREDYRERTIQTALAGTTVFYAPPSLSHVVTKGGSPLAVSQGKGEAPSLFPNTDMGNAERLVAQYGDQLRWCTPWRQWLIWDGARWAADLSEEVL